MWFAFIQVAFATQSCNVSFSNARPIFGFPTNLTASLSPTNCTGNVNFWQGLYSGNGDVNIQNYIGSVSVVGGVAKYTWANPTGQSTAFAIFDGDDNNYGTTSNYVNISALATASVLLNITSLGSNAIQLNAYLNPADATGVVQFYNTKIATTLPFIIGSASVIDGVASLNWTRAPPGPNQYQAQYMGSWIYSNYSSSTVGFTTV